MSGSEIMKQYNLPKRIKVNVKVTREGYFFANLPEYPGCNTEAQDIFDLIKNVTDAILTYFDVPRSLANKLEIVYLPPQLLTPKREQIDELVNAQKKGLEYNNIAVRFNYFTSSINSNGTNSNLRG